MGLITLKCPNCGGQIQFDENLSKGFCMYCGNAIVNDKTSMITVNQVDIESVKGSLEKAKIFLMKNDYSGAKEQSEHVLQTGTSYPDCWYLQATLEVSNPEMKSYYLDKASKAESESLGIFEKEDVEKYTLCEVTIKVPKYFDWGYGYYLISIDGEPPIRIEEKSKAKVYLQKGPHRFKIYCKPATPKLFNECLEIQSNCVVKVRTAGILIKIFADVQNS